MATLKIYGLRNPITGLYFYVGMTSQELNNRLLGHMNSTDKNKEKASLIKSIVAEGKRPIIDLIEELSLNEIPDSSSKELFWINYYLTSGHPLLNKSFTGAGRKPESDPKVLVTIYIEQRIVDNLGGKEKVKELMYGFISNYIKGTEDGI